MLKPNNDIVRLDLTISQCGGALVEGDYRTWLKNLLVDKQKKRTSLSMRAFAKKLGVSKTSLTDVLAGNRHFSPRNAERIIQSLQLGEEESKWFLKQIPKSKWYGKNDA